MSPLRGFSLFLDAPLLDLRLRQSSSFSASPSGRGFASSSDPIDGRRSVWGDAAADCRSAREGFYDATVEQVRAILKIGMTPLFFLVKKNSSALTLFLPPLHPPPPPPLSFPSTLPNTTNDAIPQYALQPTEKLSLQQMLEVGRSALLDSSGKLLLASARQAQRVETALARTDYPLQLEQELQLVKNDMHDQMHNIHVQKVELVYQYQA